MCEMSGESEVCVVIGSCVQFGVDVYRLFLVGECVWVFVVCILGRKVLGYT